MGKNGFPFVETIGLRLNIGTVFVAKGIERFSMLFSYFSYRKTIVKTVTFFDSFQFNIFPKEVSHF